MLQEEGSVNLIYHYDISSEFQHDIARALPKIRDYFQSYIW